MSIFAASAEARFHRNGALAKLVSQCFDGGLRANCQNECDLDNLDKIMRCAKRHATETCQTLLSASTSHSLSFKRKRFVNAVVRSAKEDCIRTKAAKGMSHLLGHGLSPKIDVTYEVQYDDEPLQTSWFLWDPVTSMKVIDHSGEPQADAVANGIQRGAATLVEGREYTLYMHDTGGNGLCCSKGQGSIKFFAASDGRILADYDGSFGSYFSTPFVPLPAAAAIQ